MVRRWKYSFSYFAWPFLLLPSLQIKVFSLKVVLYDPIHVLQCWWHHGSTGNTSVLMTQHIDLLGGGDPPSWIHLPGRKPGSSGCHWVLNTPPPPSGVLNISFCLHKDHKQPNPLLLSLDLINKYIDGIQLWREGALSSGNPGENVLRAAGFCENLLSSWLKESGIFNSWKTINNEGTLFVFCSRIIIRNDYLNHPT